LTGAAKTAASHRNSLRYRKAIRKKIQMPALTEFLRRAAAPRIVVATSRWRWAQNARAALRKIFGGRPTIELFFAFDDPYAAIGLPGLIRIAETRKAHLKLLPIITRGIDGDPAAEQRAVHAITDSRRLAQRDGRSLRRSAPLSAHDCEFLAAWAIAAELSPGCNAFVAAALEKLWFGSDDAPKPEHHIALYQQHIGLAPPAVSSAHSSQLANHNKRLHKLGHWESPVARVAGEWYFAHERLQQIDERLGALGA
jgi:2-hydroxychromene-2-carboxylate isomerase